MDRASLRQLKNKRPTWCHLLFYFTSYVLNMFRTLIYPPSGACDYSVELPHWSYCSLFDVCWSFGVVGLEWYPCCRLKSVVIQQNSRKLLMTDILMSETCWAHKKWNKIASDIKLVFYSSTFKYPGLETNYCYNYIKAECVNSNTQNLCIFHHECFKCQMRFELFILKILSHINSLKNEVNTVTK